MTDWNPEYLREQAESLREQARRATPGGWPHTQRLPARSYLEGGQLVHVVTTVPPRVPNGGPSQWADLTAYRLAQAYAAGQVHVPTPGSIFRDLGGVVGT